MLLQQHLDPHNRTKGYWDDHMPFISWGDDEERTDIWCPRKNAAGIGGGPGRPKGSGKKRGRRKMSVAARKAISDAQKKRSAKQKAKG